MEFRHHLKHTFGCFNLGVYVNRTCNRVLTTIVSEDSKSLHFIMLSLQVANA